MIRSLTLDLNTHFIPIPPYRNNVEAHLAELGHEILVVAHSYGGILSTEAIDGLSKKEREAQGHPGGVVAILFVSACLPKEVHLAIEALKDCNPEKEASPSLVKTVPTSSEPHVLHNHVRIMSSYPFSVFAAFDGRSLSLAKQKRMAKNAGIEQLLLGPMNCGHSPFLSHPEEASNFIQKVAGEISSWPGDNHAIRSTIHEL
ncbi:hypothetical protein EMCG_00856 [[Emmonsia] crescens]|uniref:AB hydrolase-1 domain-containing protein n=1 Tax=[Emmonsia] crescens TaxID=73230 RepID=A0A0G2IXF8_9EURO|nr:hypothetical protein EMCG_00856 [Emmonsia crescens UAMH 3008]